MARRSKYTPETVEKLRDAIRMGATYEMACSYAGISFQTFNRWRETKREFCDELKQAEGAAVVGWLSKIEQAANAGTWQAAAWKLERRYPREYGRNVTEVTGGEKPLGIVWSDPVKPDDEIGLGADELPQASEE